ncbi:hypothetical protein ABZ876_23245 [Streptomyces sp. NPDC046931]|uniref:hypothetical protein n=1 Tax=Streptomyces sp. NPDC046931 TaxID=3154806 RepID=UPI003402824A
MNSTITAPVPVPVGRWAAWYTAAFRPVGVHVFGALADGAAGREASATGVAGAPAPEGFEAAEAGAPDEAAPALGAPDGATDGAPDGATDGAPDGAAEDAPAAPCPPPGWHAVSASAAETAAVTSAAVRRVFVYCMASPEFGLCGQPVVYRHSPVQTRPANRGFAGRSSVTRR